MGRILDADKTDLLVQFQSVTGKEDMDESITILERNGWDLTVRLCCGSYRFVVVLDDRKFERNCVVEIVLEITVKRDCEEITESTKFQNEEIGRGSCLLFHVEEVQSKGCWCQIVLEITILRRQFGSLQRTKL